MDHVEQHILVPLDGSKLAETALPQALAMARAMGNALTLLQVIPPREMPPPVARADSTAEIRPKIYQEMTAHAHDYLEQVAERLQAMGLVVRTEVLEGEPAATIVSYDEQHPHVSMVVMATHGRSGVRLWVLGSVTEKVLHAAPSPLLLVRAREVEVSLGDGVPYRTITVPLDGSAVAEQALHPAQTIAAATGAALVLLSVAPSAASIPPVEGAGVIPPWTAGEFQAQTEQLAAYLVEKARELEAGGQVVRAKLVKGSPDEAILHAGDEEHADLIVMATHGRSGLQRLWLGSVARKVTQGTRLPVLLVRAQPA